MKQSRTNGIRSFTTFTKKLIAPTKLKGFNCIHWCKSDMTFLHCANIMFLRQNKMKYSRRPLLTVINIHVDHYSQ